MKRSSQLIIHIGLLLTFLMLMSAFFFIGNSIRGSEQIVLHIFPWMVLTTACMFFNEWLSGRNLPANLLVFINAILTIGSGIAGFYFLQTTPSTFTTHVFQFLFPASLALMGFYFTWFPEKPQSLVLCFDSLIALFLLYLFLDLTDILQPNDSLELYFLIMMGLVLLLIILMRMTSDEEHTGTIPKGFFPVILMITGCLLIALIFSLLISGQVKSLTDLVALILKTIITCIFWILGKIADVIGTVFLWLMNFLPDAEPIEDMMEAPITAGEELEMMQEAAFTVAPEVVVAILIAIVVISIIWLNVHLKGKRMLKKVTHKAPGKIQRSWRLPSLRNGLRKLYQELRFRIHLFRKRKTPSGLLYRIEHYGKLHNQERITGESAPAYLRRLAVLPNYAEKTDIYQALITLAELVQKEYYAGHRQKVDTELYQKIKSVF